MDVDTDNFEAALAALEQHLPKASFVALDLEMTGITGPAETQVTAGDVPQEQYSKGRAVVNRPYSIVQFGVCLFEETGAGQFECRPFNIYTYPRPVDERDANGKQVKTDPFIGLSASSIAFLVQNGLDFQRWVAKGVSYTSGAVEEALLKCIPALAGADGAAGGGQKQAEQKEKRVEPTKPQDIKLVSDTMKQVGDFAAGGGSEMQLPNTNSFLALILRQRIAEQHPALVVEKRPNAANPRLQERWVLNLSGEAQKSRHAAMRSRVMSHIGVRRAWSLLKASGKPVVVHNGFFDLLFLAAAFEGPLPQRLSEFTELIHGAFPQVFDTKILAEARDVAAGRFNQRSSLSQLVELIFGGPADEGGPGAGKAEEADAGAPAGGGGGSGAPGAALHFAAPEGFRQYSGGPDGGGGSAAFHTAGYDAYETGRVFAYFRGLLGPQRVADFGNRVFLMRSAFDMCLGGKEDWLSVQGIVRYLYDVDTAILNNRGLAELLKPLLGDGQWKATFRWCSDGRSLLLVLHDHAEPAQSQSDREACEQVLDKLLREQASSGRLQSDSLEAHLESMAGAAAEGPGAGSGEEEPAAKRRRRA